MPNTFSSSDSIGYLDSYDGNQLRGWAANLSSRVPSLVDIYTNDVFYQTVEASVFREDLLSAGTHDGKVSFNLDMPLQKLFCQYGSDLRLAAKFHNSTTHLVGSPIQVRPPEIGSHLEIFNSNMLTGWVMDKNNPHIQLVLNVWVDGKVVEQCPASLESLELKSRHVQNYFHGYCVHLGKFTNNNSWTDIRLTLDYDKEYTLISDTKVPSSINSIEALIKLQNKIRHEGFLEGESEVDMIVSRILPAAIESLRRNTIKYADHELLSVAAVEHKLRKIAVIIPIYKKLELVRQCIESVISSCNDREYELILINDHSPERGVSEYLQDVSLRSKCKLIEHSKSKGIAACINNGIQYAIDADIVVLNSYTQVGNGWLDKLNQDAYSDKMIGTVSPLCNSAGIFSFPKINYECSILNSTSLHDLVKATERCREKPVAVPSGYGHCLYVKRDLLNELGDFDDTLWGKGPGECQDFCLKAEMYGWKNVASNKTFIQYTDFNPSYDFGEEFKELNRKKLDTIYPDYSERLKSFTEDDPLSKMKREIFINFLNIKKEQKEINRSVLFVSHQLGGGTEVSIRKLADRLIDDDIDIFCLRSIDKNLWLLESYRWNISAKFSCVNEINELAATLMSYGIFHIHYHQTIEFQDNVWDLPALLKCDYDMTLHDYYVFCPRLNLTNAIGVYCGEPSLKGCRSCVKENGVYSGARFEDKRVDVGQWRSTFETRLRAARKVFSPSESVAKSVARVFDLNNIVVKPHVDSSYIPERKIFSSDSNKRLEQSFKCLNIGIVGAITDAKGLHVLKRMAEYIESSGEQIRLIVVGYTFDDDFFKRYSFVTITGRYKPEGIDDVLVNLDIDVFFIPSTFPETYSFVYSELTRRGYPLAAFNLGALAERIKDSGYGSLIELSEDISSIVSALRATAAHRNLTYKRMGHDYPSPILKSYYEF